MFANSYDERYSGRNMGWKPCAFPVAIICTVPLIRANNQKRNEKPIKFWSAARERGAIVGIRTSACGGYSEYRIQKPSGPADWYPTEVVKVCN